MQKNDSQNLEATELVWYVSYGSNLLYERFSHYIGGGKFGLSKRELPGCSDTTPPREERPLTLQFQMYFAGLSKTWNGPVAFIDPEQGGETLARAYLITRQQFWQIVAQESLSTIGGQPPTPDDLPTDASGITGEGKYDRLVNCGDLDGYPLLTFTSPTRHETFAPPMPAYLQTIGLGLCEAHGISPAEAAQYLATRAGVKGNYSAQLIQQLIEELVPAQTPAPELATSPILSAASV